MGRNGPSGDLEVNGVVCPKAISYLPNPTLSTSTPLYAC